MTTEPAALKEKIEEKRSKMVQLGLQHGFCHEEVVRCSQELDALIFAYQKMTSARAGKGITA